MPVSEGQGWDAQAERVRLRREVARLTEENRNLYALLGIMVTMTPYPSLAIELACRAAGVNAANAKSV